MRKLILLKHLSLIVFVSILSFSTAVLVHANSLDNKKNPFEWIYYAAAKRMSSSSPEKIAYEACFELLADKYGNFDMNELDNKDCYDEFLESLSASRLTVMSKYLLSIFVCLISVSFAVAQEEYGVDTNHDLPVGLNVGDKAPYFKAHDLEGNLFDSKETLKDKDIILIFYRGHWCAACDMYLSNISDSLNLLSEKGAIVVAITPETP